MVEQRGAVAPVLHAEPLHGRKLGLPDGFWGNLKRPIDAAPLVFNAITGKAMESSGRRRCWLNTAAITTNQFFGDVPASGGHAAGPRLPIFRRKPAAPGQ
jgi:hypothetical protein